MSSAAARRRYTPEEYIALERAAGHKSEYLDGEIFAMAGASYEHNLLVGNLLIAVGSRLVDGPCRSLPSDMRVHVPSTGLYTYPDVVVICDEPSFQDDEFDTLLNPTVLFEVLSPSTEAYDRGAKFRHYRSIDSLRQYVLVAQDRASVEVYTRTDNGWIFAAFDSIDATLRLASIGCEVPLEAIYARVVFPPPVEDEPGNRPRR